MKTKTGAPRERKTQTGRQREEDRERKTERGRQKVKETDGDGMEEEEPGKEMVSVVFRVIW